MVERDAAASLGEVPHGPGDRLLAEQLDGAHFVDDGRIEAHNNAAERALRGVAIGRKNFLHLGSDAGGRSAAVIYTLIGTARLNGMDPQAYLRHVLEHIADHPSNPLEVLLPWAVAAKGGRARAGSEAGGLRGAAPAR